jgi:hypothetical protein
MNTVEPNQFAAVLPHYEQMADAAAFMQRHALNMYANGAAMVRDMEAIADNLRNEEAELEREHAIRLARIRNHRITVEGMIAHHLGVMRPEAHDQQIEHQNVVTLPVREKPVVVARPRRKVFGVF